MLEWYFPWDQVDGVLRIQLAIWIGVVVFSFWVSWRTLIAKKPWLRLPRNTRK